MIRHSSSISVYDVYECLDVGHKAKPLGTCTHRKQNTSIDFDVKHLGDSAIPAKSSCQERGRVTDLCIKESHPATKRGHKAERRFWPPATAAARIRHQWTMLDQGQST